MKMIWAALAVILVAIFGFLYYMGMFSLITPAEKMMGPYTMVYEEFVGDYSKSGPVFEKVYKALVAEGVTTTRRGIGVYYDNPRDVPADKRRSDCGAIIEGVTPAKMQELSKKFKVRTIQASSALVVAFPIKNMLSYMFGPAKAYPALTEYARAHDYTVTSTYEIYDMPAKEITFVMTVTK